jgi:phage terminase large subunit-like protein
MNNKTFEDNIESIQVEDVESIDVYNLELKDNNNFFVDNLLVHNSIIVIDDPINPKNAESVVHRKSSIHYYTRSLYNRLTPVQYGIRIIIMQRLHENDLSGYLLKNSSDSYRHICLPAEQSKLVTPIELNSLYREGLLDPIRLDRKTLKDMKSTLGSRGYSGQYEQTPSPDEGGIFKEFWYDIVRPELIQRNYQEEPIHFFIDSAYTDKTENDPTAILTCFKQGNFIYVLDVIQVWKTFPDLLKFIPEYVSCFQYNSQSKIFIEPKASGISIAQQLRSVTMLNIVETPSPQDSKVTRAHGISPIHESRRFKLIEGSYIQPYLEQLKLFPNATHDDMVDVTTMSTSELLVNNNPDFVFI